MRIERNTPPEWEDEEVTRVLRDVYASPAPNASNDRAERDPSSWTV